MGLILSHFWLELRSGSGKKIQGECLLEAEFM